MIKHFELLESYLFGIDYIRCTIPISAKIVNIWGYYDYAKNVKSKMLTIHF